MPEHTHVRELIPAYALDCLDDEELIRVSEHVASCSTCRSELQSYLAVVDQLAVAVPEATPPADLKRRLTDRVRSAPLPAVTEPGSSWRERLPQLWRRAAPAWGAVSLVLILALALSNLMLRQQAREPQLVSGGMRVVTLTGTEAAPGATGILVISGDGEYGTLVADGLSPLDEAHKYQLWLIKNGQRTDAGVFSVNSEGYGALWISSPTSLSSYSSFGVTVEPAGGSPGPTGDRVLGGSL